MDKNIFQVVKCPNCSNELLHYKIDEFSNFIIKVRCPNCEKNIKVKGGIFK